MSAEADKNAERYHVLALIYGYNELAKKGQTLGEKVYFRMARSAAEEQAEKLGVEVKHDDVGNVVLELSQRSPWIIFHERDIELMRRAVADHDIAQADKALAELRGGPQGEREGS